MKKLDLTFPCILDSSPDAAQTANGKYACNAVPTTYLIDREGKIRSAWVGFSEDDENAKAALKKLGLE